MKWALEISRRKFRQRLPQLPTPMIPQDVNGRNHPLPTAVDHRPRRQWSLDTRSHFQPGVSFATRRRGAIFIRGILVGKPVRKKGFHIYHKKRPPT
jgi:hypothetical protein